MPAYTNCELAEIACDLAERLVLAEAAITSLTASLDIPWPVLKGGTGSTTVTGARVNLNINTVTLAAADTVINWQLSTSFYTSLVANRTFTFTNSANGLGIQFVIENTGAFTPTFPVGIIWPGLTAQPDVPASGEKMLYTLTMIGGVTYGVYVLYA